MNSSQVVRGLGLFLASLAFVACSSGGQPDPPAQGPESCSTVDGIPTIKLSDEKVVVLDRLDLREALIERFPTPPETAPDDGLEAQSLTLQHLPVRVDLSPLQTPIGDQGGWGTCVAFATTAAIEAAYKRERGLTLDLSERT